MFGKTALEFAATLVYSFLVMGQDDCPCYHRMVGDRDFIVCENRSLTAISDCVPSNTTHLTISTPTISLVPETMQRFTNLYQFVISDFKDLIIISIDIFSNNPSLHNFDIQSTSIDYIDSRWFKYAPNLAGVGMINSNITSVPENTFSSLSKLEYVQLHGNQLTTLPATLFEGTSLIGLTLANNLWHCECELMKFLRGLWDNGAFLEDEPLCWQPLELKGIKLNDLNEELACAH